MTQLDGLVDEQAGEELAELADALCDHAFKAGTLSEELGRIKRLREAAERAKPGILDIPPEHHSVVEFPTRGNKTSQDP